MASDGNMLVIVTSGMGLANMSALGLGLLASANPQSQFVAATKTWCQHVSLDDGHGRMQL